MKKLFGFSALIVMLACTACTKQVSNPPSIVKNVPPAATAPIAGTNCIGPNPPCRPPAPPPPTPEEYFGQGYQKAYNMIIAGTVPSKDNAMYQASLTLAINNGLHDYQNGLMAGATDGDVAIKGAWFPGVTTIPDVVGFTAVTDLVTFFFRGGGYLSMPYHHYI